MSNECLLSIHDTILFISIITLLCMAGWNLLLKLGGGEELYILYYCTQPTIEVCGGHASPRNLVFRGPYAGLQQETSSCHEIHKFNRYAKEANGHVITKENSVVLI